MRHLLHGRRPLIGALAGATVIVAALGGTAGAAPLITGAQVKDGSLTGRDIQSRSIALSDLSLRARASLRGRQGVAGPRGAAGATGLRGPSAPAAAGLPGPPGDAGPPGRDPLAGYSTEPWGVIDRNSYGSPVAQGRVGPLGRTGPTDFSANEPTPYGTGSLSVLVDNDPAGNNIEKLAYGNETNYAGATLASFVTLDLWIYATAEDDAAANIIQPGITLEVDPDTTTPAGSNYSSLVYVPPAPAATSTWLQYDASVGPHWFATGSTGISSGCNQTTFCTLAQLKAALPNAAVTYGVAISKGRDSSFLGAVDGLRINGFTYDFEALGVKKIATP